MQISDDKKKELMEEIEAAYGEAASTIDGGYPFKAVTEYVSNLLIEYWSKGYQDGLEVGQNESRT
jgi:hypothetical protein